MLVNAWGIGPGEGYLGGSHCVWLFEAKGVQRYIFAAGPLRDLIGASELVHGIACSDGADLVQKVLDELRAKDRAFPELTFSRRAGGAFSLHGERAVLERVRNQMRLAVMTTRPGLAFIDSFGEGESAMAALEAAYAGASGIRANLAAGVLPLGRPPMLVAAETGLPAIEEAVYRGRGGAVAERRLLDRVTHPQRAQGNRLQRRLVAGAMDGVARRFHGTPQANRPFVYPRNLADAERDPGEEDTLANPLFPWRNGSDRRIAIVHIDISGLGELFRQKGGQSPQAKMALARAIENVIVSAVQAANHAVLLPEARDRQIGADVQAVVPARPLVLGGDDVTVLVRADLALAFTMRALEEIERRSSADPDVGPLSAGAGIAIVGASMPFLHAHALAESLCKHAKGVAKKVERAKGQAWPSALAFHLQTSTDPEVYADILAKRRDPGGFIHTANPYGVGARADDLPCPSAQSVLDLAGAIARLPGASGALRQIEGARAEGGLAEADRLWRNWRKAAGRAHGALREAVDERLVATGVPAIAEERLSVAREDGTTAVFDALRLIDICAVAAQADAAAPAAEAA